MANGSTLKVLDIRNPALPLPEVGTANSRYGPMSSIAVSGDLAFLTGSALQCFDVADPTAPLYRGIHDSDGGAVWTAWPAAGGWPTSPRGPTSSRTPSS